MGMMHPEEKTVTGFLQELFIDPPQQIGVIFFSMLIKMREVLRQSHLALLIIETCDQINLSIYLSDSIVGNCSFFDLSPKELLLPT
jgi:hypothetical protein